LISGVKDICKRKAKDKMNHTKAREGAQQNFIVIKRRQVFLLFTCTKGSMRPSATKRGYIISHSDLSKPIVLSEPSRGMGAPKAWLTSTSTFLDLFCGASVSVAFRHRVFFVFWTDELLK
jgi:hypothetical protein